MSTEYERTNSEAEFLPARNTDELPAVRIGAVLVLTYVDKRGVLRVTVDTEDATDPVNIKINVNAGTVWEGSDR